MQWLEILASAALGGFIGVAIFLLYRRHIRKREGSTTYKNDVITWDYPFLEKICTSLTSTPEEWKILVNNPVIIIPTPISDNDKKGEVSIKDDSAGTASTFYASLYYGSNRISLSPEDSNRFQVAVKTFVAARKQEKQRKIKEQLEQELKKNVV